MNGLSEFQQRAVAIGFYKMLTAKHFNICDLDSLGEVLDRNFKMNGRDYAALRSVHCVNWEDMGPELAQQVREKCCELLGISTDVLEGTAREVKPRENKNDNLRALFKVLV